MLWLPVLGAILVWASPPVIPAQRTPQRANNFHISPKPCAVNGVKGTCMFVYECIQSRGRHVGMCVDTFMFGSCCSNNITDAASDASAPSPASSQPAVLYSPPSSNKYSPSMTSRPPSGVSSGNKYSPAITNRPPQHGANSSSYTTTSQKFKPSQNNVDKTQVTNHKFTARPPSSPVSNHIMGSSNRPNFISSSGSSAKYPSYSGYGKPYRPHGGYSSLSPKPSNTASDNVNHNTVNSLQPSDKPSKPTTSHMPASRPSSVISSRPPPTNQTNWGMSPPISETLSTSGSSLITMWTSSEKFPTSLAWQVTTEPTFVTRPRPSSSTSYRPSPPMRLRPTRRPLTTLPTTLPPTTTPPTTTTPSTTTASTTTTTTTTPLPSTTEEEMTVTTQSSVSASSADKPVQCGVPTLTARPEMRIVGGKNAPFGGWPWQVSVRRTSFFGFSSTHRCGGAVLNENWIATAGHCVDDLLTSQIRIRVGEYDFSSVQEPHPFIERAVARKVVHPKYNFFTYEYDLALVRLEAALEFAPHVSPICLPASDDLLIGENATVTGWGRLSEGGTLPSILQEVSVPIVSNEQCKSMFLRAGRHEFIPEIFLCAGYEKGGQDSCQGDSGGPLQVRGKDGRYFLAGIISWGIGCAEANLPGVCTRISKFVNWILENVT